MLREVLETRAKLLQKMVPSGQFSMSDLCRFFEVDKTRIEVAARMENVDLLKLRKEPNPKMTDFLKKRDQKFWDAASKDGEEKACIQFGLSRPPMLLEAAREVKEAFSLDSIAKEMELPLWEEVKETKNVYEGIFKAQNLWDAKFIAEFMKIPGEKEFNDDELKTLFQKGKMARFTENEVILDLSIVGEKASSIAQWTETKKLQNEIKTFSNLISEKGLSLKPDRAELKEFLLKGETARDLKDVFPIAMNKDLPDLLDEIRLEMNREGKGALDFRKQIKVNAFKDVFFEEYVKNGLTQQEIADKYGTTRTEVNQTLKEVKQERKDEVMDFKMELWRARNVSEPLRKRREMREKAVLENYDYDKSCAQIAFESNCSLKFVTDFLESKGLSTASLETTEILKNEIRKEWKAGTNAKDIAKILGKSVSTVESFIQVLERERRDAIIREDLMKMAYKDGLTTPEIQKMTGMKRNEILSKQQKSSRYLLGHPELKPPVIENKGDVPGIFSDQENFKKERGIEER